MDIHQCCRTGNLERLRQLIADGALTNVNEKDDNGWTLLHFASNYGNLEIVKELLKNGASIDEKDNIGQTSLYDASRLNHLEIVKELLKNGAFINAKSITGWTSLYLAAYHDHLELVKELLKNNAQVNEQNNSGWTALHSASYWNHLEIVKVLIDYSDLSITNNKGETALDVAKTQEIKDFIANYQELPIIKEPEYN